MVPQTGFILKWGITGYDILMLNSIRSLVAWHFSWEPPLSFDKTNYGPHLAVTHGKTLTRSIKVLPATVLFHSLNPNWEIKAWNYLEINWSVAFWWQDQMSLNRYPGLDHFCTLACWPISPRHGKKLKRNRQENVIYKLSHRMYPTYSGHIELLLTILARLLNIIGQRESTFKTEVESEVGNAKRLNFSILSTFVFKRQSINHLHTWTISTTAPSPPHSSPPPPPFQSASTLSLQI